MTILEDIKAESLLRVYIEQSPGNGNQANSLNFLRYFLHHGFKGKVQFIYANDETKRKLEKLFDIIIDYPVKTFANTDLFSYEQADSFEFVNLYYFDTHPTKFENCKYLISGGEPEPRSGELAIALKANMLVCSPPYTYFKMSAPFVAYQNGSLIPFPSAVATNPPYFVADETQIKAHLAKSSNIKSQNLLRVLERKNTQIQSVYGLHDFKLLSKIAEAAELTRTKLIESQQIPAGSTALILFHYNLDEETRQNLGARFLFSRLDQNDFAEQLKDNRTIVVETGGVAFELFNYLLVRPSLLPPFQEGENSRNLLTYFGRPFVHVVRADFSMPQLSKQLAYTDSNHPNHWLMGAPPAIRDELDRLIYAAQQGDASTLSDFYLNFSDPNSALLEHFKSRKNISSARYDILTDASSTVTSDFRDPSSANLVRDFRYPVLNFTGNCSSINTRHEWDRRFDSQLSRFGFPLQRCTTLFLQLFTTLYHCPNITTANGPRLNSLRQDYFDAYPGLPSLEKITAFLSSEKAAAEPISANLFFNFIVAAGIVFTSSFFNSCSKNKKLSCLIMLNTLSLFLASNSASSYLAYTAGSLAGLFAAQALKYHTETPARNAVFKRN